MLGGGPRNEDGGRAQGSVRGVDGLRGFAEVRFGRERAGAGGPARGASRGDSRCGGGIGRGRGGELKARGLLDREQE